MWIDKWPFQISAALICEEMTACVLQYVTQIGYFYLRDVGATETILLIYVTVLIVLYLVNLSNTEHEPVNEQELSELTLSEYLCFAPYCSLNARHRLLLCLRSP